jgi:hypothetical protein
MQDHGVPQQPYVPLDWHLPLAATGLTMGLGALFHFCLSVPSWLIDL